MGWNGMGWQRIKCDGMGWDNNNNNNDGMGWE